MEPYTAQGYKRLSLSWGYRRLSLSWHVLDLDFSQPLASYGTRYESLIVRVQLQRANYLMLQLVIRPTHQLLSITGTWTRTAEHGYEKLSWRLSSTRMSWNVDRGHSKVAGAFSSKWSTIDANCCARWVAQTFNPSSTVNTNVHRMSCACEVCVSFSSAVTF
jgi:hypothetical protein